MNMVFEIPIKNTRFNVINDKVDKFKRALDQIQFKYLPECDEFMILSVFY